MKRILMGIVVLGMVLGMAGTVAAEKTYMLNLPTLPATGVTVPMAPGGTSTFVVTPAYGGASGVTVIDRPWEKGATWTLQVQPPNGTSVWTTGISPFTAGQSHVTDYQTIGYRISLYFSDFIDQAQSGGSVYTLPSVYMTGATPQMHTITIPPCRYMWGRVTALGSVSAWWSLPVMLYPAEQGN